MFRTSCHKVVLAATTSLQFMRLTYTHKHTLQDFFYDSEDEEMLGTKGSAKKVATRLKAVKDKHKLELAKVIVEPLGLLISTHNMVLHGPGVLIATTLMQKMHVASVDPILPHGCCNDGEVRNHANMWHVLMSSFTVAEVQAKLRTLKNSTKSYVADKVAKVKADGDCKLKKAKDAFRKWRVRNPSSGLAMDWGKATKTKDEASCQKLMDRWNTEFASSKFGASEEFLQKVSHKHINDTKETGMHFFDVCAEYHLAAKDEATSGEIARMVKMGALKRTALKGKARETAEEGSEFPGDAKMYSYTKTRENAAKVKMEEDRHNKFLTRDATTADQLQDWLCKHWQRC